MACGQRIGATTTRQRGPPGAAISCKPSRNGQSLLMTRDIAIDPGSANTPAFVKGRGIVLNEPTVVAMNERTAELPAMGNAAWTMIVPAPGQAAAVRPLRHG